MKLGELFLELGIIGDTAEITAISTAVSALDNTFMAAKMAIDIAYDSLEKFIGMTIQGVVALTNFQQQTDLSIEKLQGWQVASQLANPAMSAEEVTNSISNLQSNLTKIRLGIGNPGPFSMLNINPYQEAFGVMEDLRDRIEELNIDSPTAITFMSQMSISPNMINVLRLSREEFQKLTKEMLLTSEQRKGICLCQSKNVPHAVQIMYHLKS